MVFWVLTPYNLLGRYKRVEGTHRLHPRGDHLKTEAIHPSEMLLITYRMTPYHNPKTKIGMLPLPKLQTLVI
jgi:hypothetical protein